MVRALARSLCLFLDFTIILFLVTKVYKWVPENLMLGELPCDVQASHLEEILIPLVASCERNRDKLRPLRCGGISSSS